MSRLNSPTPLSAPDTVTEPGHATREGSGVVITSGRIDDAAAALRLERHVWQWRTVLFSGVTCGVVFGLVSLFADVGPAAVGVTSGLAVNLSLQAWRVDERERVGVLRSVLGLSRRSTVLARYRTIHLFCAAVAVPYALIVGAAVLAGIRPVGAVMGIAHLVGCWYALTLVITPLRVRGHSVPALVIGILAMFAAIALHLGAVTAAQSAGLAPAPVQAVGLACILAAVMAGTPLSMRHTLSAYQRTEL